MHYLKRGIGVLVCMLLISNITSASRSFPGLPITSRATRGADESWRYFSPQGYQNRLQRTKRYQDWLAGSGDDTTGDFARRQQREELNTMRDQFLASEYPLERQVDTIIREVDGKNLLWGLGFHRQKTKIVIHHTVTRQVTNADEAKESLQGIYKQHTITQGRGDIGYNLLLDPLGNIYEGRAGGADVIGAHADRNNTRTIGVALMGNYDINQPSPRMRGALKKLVFGLMLQYGIDPLTKQPYFTPITTDPGLTARLQESIVGHRDTRNTVCPGQFVYNRLPALRTEMNQMFTTLQSRRKASLAQFRFLQKKLPVRIDTDSVVATYPMPNRVIRDCALFGEGVTLEQCGGNGQDLVVRFQTTSSTPSGQYVLLVDTDAGAVWIDVVVVAQSQLDTLLRNRQQQQPLTTPPQQLTEKTEVAVPISAARELMNRSVSVLLYEPTAEMSSWDFRCESGCAVILDTERFQNITQVTVRPSEEDPSRLAVVIDGRTYQARSLRLSNPRSMITIENRTRGTERYPLNYFRGDITIQREGYTLADTSRREGWTVVNHLPVEQYLRGVAETIESQHPEKLRAMSLLVKGYVLRYLGGNRHPSVPEGVTYQAIDDPRLFQKYVGAGIEQTTPRRQQALQKTMNEFVVYENNLPILPYFHCSAGFIRSGRERFGWTDTPWLVSKLDVASCLTDGFQGHGVGLSGNGAERLAQAGATYAQIIRYYYAGVDIVR